MADNGQGNGKGAADNDNENRIRVLGQYIKDLSFENPNVAKLLGPQSEQPNLDVNINVGASQVADNVFESAIEFKAKATAKFGVVYELELVYAGLLQFENVPDASREPLLLISGPALLFPFARRIVADTVREGGFPPLLLDPVDFGALYARRQQAGTGKPS